MKKVIICLFVAASVAMVGCRDAATCTKCSCNAGCCDSGSCAVEDCSCACTKE